MVTLIEDNDSLNNLFSQEINEITAEIIPISPNIHPALNSMSLLFISLLNTDSHYVIGINHTDCLGVNIEKLTSHLSQINKIYVKDKKSFLHYFCLNNIYDVINDFNVIVDLKTYCKKYYTHYKQHIDLNRYIPLTVLMDYYLEIQPILQSNKNSTNIFLNSKSSVVFYYIEQNGIKVDKSIFENFFHPITSDKTYTQYNLKTQTTRPSNKYNGVNYAALNKKNNCRSSFIPQNDLFVEIDITSYHPTLAAKLINYDLKGLTPYEYLSEKMNLDVKNIKEIMFNILYGGKFDDVLHLDFFQKLKTYINNMWEKYNKDGYIEESISGYKFYKDQLTDMNPYKLFSYYLQCMETSQNVLILWDIIKCLKNLNTKIVLYTYDSILIDLDDDEDEILDIIDNIFNKYGFKTKIKSGINYNF